MTAPHSSQMNYQTNHGFSYSWVCQPHFSEPFCGMFWGQQVNTLANLEQACNWDCPNWTNWNCIKNISLSCAADCFTRKSWWLHLSIPSLISVHSIQSTQDDSPWWRCHQRSAQGPKIKVCVCACVCVVCVCVQVCVWGGGERGVWKMRNIYCARVACKTPLKYSPE